MAEAREIMDRLTEAVFKKDFDTARSLHAPDALSITPDAGELTGPDAAVAYLRQFVDAFPDAQYETRYELECGDTAVDEGYFVGTHTQPLRTPDGQEIPATGRAVRVRGCDIVTVADGKVTSHRFYFDQMEFLGQLGLAPEAG